MVHINFKYSREEIIKAYASHIREKLILLFYTIFGVFFLLVGIAGLLSDDEDGLTLNIILIAAALYLFVRRFLRKKGYAKVYDSHITWREDIECIFSDKSFKNSSKNFSNEINWNIIYKVVENSEFFYIYISKNVFQIIPKRAFTSEQLHAFKEILKLQKNLRKE